VTAQVNELTKIHQSFYDLEAQHSKVRQQYEDEVNRLRTELHAARQGIAPGAAQHPIVGPGSIGIPGPSGASSSAPGIQLSSGPQTYANEPYYPRERERERDKEREREQRDRDRERDRAERERESDNRERERPPRDARVGDAEFKRGMGDRDPKRGYNKDRMKMDRPGR
jgi:glucose repression regulatory protein TUP1